MELYFLRHGQSVPRSEWSDDVSRPLTEAGVSEMAHAAWTLARLGVTPDVLITSPWNAPNAPRRSWPRRSGSRAGSARRAASEGASA